MIKMIEDKNADKLGPAGFGRFLHDAFNAVQSERTSENVLGVYYPVNAFLMFAAIDALLTSMHEQNPQDALVKELRDELSQVDRKLGRSVYSFKRAELKIEELNEIDAIIGKILRKLGVIRSGTVETEDSNECAMMEEELK
jgi:hypothetical protein